MKLKFNWGTVSIRLTGMIGGVAFGVWLHSVAAGVFMASMATIFEAMSERP